MSLTPLRPYRPTSRSVPSSPGRSIRGHWPSVPKLPTVRALAADLGLAVNTVARAYRELEAAQLVETRGRAGSFVASNGDRSRSAAAAAAAEFVRAIDSIGIDRAEALAIVRAALVG